MDARSYDRVCLVTSTVILGAGCVQCSRGHLAWCVVVAAGVASWLMRGHRCLVQGRCGDCDRTHPVLMTADYACAALALGAAAIGCLGRLVEMPAWIASGLFVASGFFMTASPVQRLVHTVGHAVVAAALVCAAVAAA